MPDPQTPSIGLAQPVRNSDVGVWDTPVNGNMGIIDSAFGATATIGLNNANVVLSAAQFQSGYITFNSTLTGSVVITFPSTFTKGYKIKNICTGSSAFTITLQTTVAGGQAIACEPGNPFDVWNDGTNLTFTSRERIGTYWDYAGSSVPSWVSGCTVPPYLNCDGTTFSSATYPALAVVLGGTTLPGSFGRFRATLNQGTGRITAGASTGGIDGNTLFASGGVQTIALSSQNIPPVPITDPGHFHIMRYDASIFSGGPTGAVDALGTGGVTANSCVATTGISAGSTSPTNFTNLPPAYIGGLTLIRAA